MIESIISTGTETTKTKLIPPPPIGTNRVRIGVNNPNKRIK